MSCLEDWTSFIQNISVPISFLVVHLGNIRRVLGRWPLPWDGLQQFIYHALVVKECSRGIIPSMIVVVVISAGPISSTWVDNDR